MRVAARIACSVVVGFVVIAAVAQTTAAPPNSADAAIIDTLSRAIHEPRKDKRAAMLRDFLREHPGNMKASELLFGASEDITEQERIYALLKSARPADPFLPFNMAGAYIHADVQLDKALALLDETDQRLAQSSAPVETVGQVKKFMATMRADILIRQNKPEAALAALQKYKSTFRAAHSYYLLGEALEKAGKKREAIDAYMEAVVHPSPDDAKHSAALERVWLSEKLGTRDDLQKKIEKKLAEEFKDANYVPKLTSRPAPQFELTTVRGERLTSSALRGKKVILNFWSPWCGPCLPELAPLQQFQADHAELVVVAIAMPPAEDKDIAKIVNERNLTTLRIGKGSAELWDKFGLAGVPNTVVIDEMGEVRIRHEGALADVPRYLETDLKAIAASGAAKQAQPAGVGAMQ
ncbi:MAG: redoxin domain-containing protein [Acidobacteria bacterium]|nr:redoxin domain-containing protein [Acidobacteriota bacterium]